MVMVYVSFLSRCVKVVRPFPISGGPRPSVVSIILCIIRENQHAYTDARLSPAPQVIVVVYWRQRHTRLGPPSPSPYGHSGHGLTHDTESYASMALSTVRLGCPSTEVPGNRGGQGWRVAWVVREPRAKATPPSQRRSPGGCPGARSAPPRPL